MRAVLFLLWHRLFANWKGLRFQTAPRAVTFDVSMYHPSVSITRALIISLGIRDDACEREREKERGYATL